MPLYPPDGGGGSGSGAAVWLNYDLINQEIRGSYNVASVTYHGTGDITINFDEPLADDNFAMLATGAQNDGVPDGYTFFVDPNAYPPTTTSCRVVLVQIDLVLGYIVKNTPQICVACFI